jgi:hypothetical protein
MNGQFKQWYEALCKRYSVCYDNHEDLLQEAFEAGAAKEREACADLCYQLVDNSRETRFASAIRARGEK